MKNLFFLLTFLILVSLFSCQKHSNNEIEATVLFSSQEGYYDCSNSNPGLIHNMGLNLIVNSYLDYSDWTYNEIFDSLQIFTRNHLMEVVSSQSTTTISSASMDTMFMIMDPLLPYIVDLHRDTITQYILNNSTYPNLGLLIDDLLEISSILKTDFETIEDGLDSLINHKNYLISQNKMNSVLNVSINVAIASICYWDNSSDEWGSIDYNTFGPMQSDVRSRFWNTINGMAESDFWSGAVVTAVTFNPFLGVSAACYGSAAKGIKDLVTGQCC